jgi:hypothetical protein
MSADDLRELRKAAETLRERADQAGNAPWDAEVHDDGRAWINAPEDHHAISLHGWPGAARYIATMHPGVGLVIADWLENTASAWSFSKVAPGSAVKAMAVARLINGGAV